MGEQMLDRDGRPQRLEFWSFLSAAGPDLHLLQFGNVLHHRIFQVEISLLHEPERGHAGDDLGHGIDAANGVLFHRQLLFQIAITIGLEIDDLTVTRHESDNPRVQSIIHEAADDAAHCLQALGIEPGGLRLGYG